MISHKTIHDENLKRLARIEGQIKGIQRMVREREYCVDIVTQIQAAQSALAAVARKVLEKHLDSCVSESLRSKSKADLDRKIAELMGVMKRMCR